MTPRDLADWLDRRGALFDEEAAATIRAQTEALKIATEALDKVKETSMVGGVYSTEGYAHDECVSAAAQALVRIKRVPS